MKIYSIRRSNFSGKWYTTYFGVVTKNRTGFNNEHIACVRTYVENDGAPCYVPFDGVQGIMDIENARKKWDELLKPSDGIGIVIDSEGEDVFKSNGKEPMMDSEIITEVDTYAEANSL